MRSVRTRILATILVVALVLGAVSTVVFLSTAPR
jgi:hypothetical protein